VRHARTIGAGRGQRDAWSSSVYRRKARSRSAATSSPNFRARSAPAYQAADAPEDGHTRRTGTAGAENAGRRPVRSPLPFPHSCPRGWHAARGGTRPNRPDTPARRPPCRWPSARSRQRGRAPWPRPATPRSASGRADGALVWESFTRGRRSPASPAPDAAPMPARRPPRVARGTRNDQCPARPSGSAPGCTRSARELPAQRPMYRAGGMHLVKVLSRRPTAKEPGPARPSCDGPEQVPRPTRTGCVLRDVAALEAKGLPQRTGRRPGLPGEGCRTCRHLEPDARRLPPTRLASPRTDNDSSAEVKDRPPGPLEPTRWTTRSHPATRRSSYGSS
jgi:hypothetical protein